MTHARLSSLTRDAVLDAAREAHARRDWPRACVLFAEAGAAGDLAADDLYAWSDAAWWVGDNDTLFATCERAYRRYVEDGRGDRAAMAALDIAAAHFLAGNESVASGWIGRASRHLEGRPECAEHGYLTYLLEIDAQLGGVTPSAAGVVEDLIAAARRVREIGRCHGDRTLETAATTGEGRVLVRIGRVAEGLALLDEAHLAVLTDDLIPAWTGNFYCHLIAAAEELGDLRRARDWTDSMTRWLGTMPAATVFSGICRVHRAKVQQLAGAWDDAEREAARVCVELGRLHVTAAARAHHQVGDIRRLRGDLAGAEAAYARAHALGRDPQPGLGLLRLAQGRPAVASTSIRTALLAEGTPFVRATLLAAQVEIDIAAGDLEQASRAADELDAIAGLFGSSGLHVASRYARGALLFAGGRTGEALPVLRAACRAWSEVDAPYDCARVRLLLAGTYRHLGDEDAATRELDAAIAAFERLGATVDLRRASALRRPASRGPGGLTPRESEVLTLVASGRSNKAIARQLGVSDRTVARHLANIFAKLGVGSRTAAAAFAFENGLAEPAPDRP